MAEYDWIRTVLPPPVVPFLVNQRAVGLFEARQDRAEAFQIPGLALMEGVEEETRAALMKRDAKIAAIAVGIAFLIGVRGLPLIAIGAAPFVLARNPMYRAFAWRVPV